MMNIIITLLVLQFLYSYKSWARQVFGGVHIVNFTTGWTDWLKIDLSFKNYFGNAPVVQLKYVCENNMKTEQHTWQVLTVCSRPRCSQWVCLTQSKVLKSWSHMGITGQCHSLSICTCQTNLNNKSETGMLVSEKLPACDQERKM